MLGLLGLLINSIKYSIHAFLTVGMVSSSIFFKTAFNSFVVAIFLSFGMLGVSSEIDSVFFRPNILFNPGSSRDFHIFIDIFLFFYYLYLYSY